MKRICRCAEHKFSLLFQALLFTCFFVVVVVFSLCFSLYFLCSFEARYFYCLCSLLPRANVQMNECVALLSIFCYLFTLKLNSYTTAYSFTLFFYLLCSVFFLALFYHIYLCYKAPSYLGHARHIQKKKQTIHRFHFNIMYEGDDFVLQSIFVHSIHRRHHWFFNNNVDDDR